MSSNRIILWLGLAAMAWAVAGCSGDSDSPAAARILSFQSSPSEIESGRWATLSWETANANKVELVEVGGEPIALGEAAASRGSVQVSPVVTTQYELRAFGKGSGVASQVTTVNVIPKEEAPTIVSFVADPEHISLGDTVVLSWTTTAADRVRISDATGATIAVADGEEAAEGEVSLKPHGSTTYHLLATGKGGEVEAEVAVGVHGQPAVTFKAPAQPIEPGAEAQLQWSATHANHVTITDEAGVVVYDGAELEGQVTVQPEETTVYTAVARNEAAEGSARATVAVQPLIDVFEAHTERPVYPGEQVEVRWQVRGAKEVTITRLGLDPWVAPEEARAEGSVMLPVGSDGSFRLRARSGALSTEALASVTMENLPRIKEFSISPALVSADANHPATVTLSWSIDGASHLQMEGDDGQKVAVAGLSPQNGSIEVQVRGTTTFRLSAFNEHGVSVVEKQVIAQATPSIDSFVALPSVAAVGEEIQIFWETSNAVAVVLEKVGAGALGANLPVDGSIRDSILQESSYVLKATNSLGHETVSEPITVRIGNPAIVDFTADRRVVRPGLPVTLTWQNIGGQELVIADQNGVEVLDLEGKKCSTTDPFRIGAASCVIPGPAVGQHTLTLTLRNGLLPATEATAFVELESVAGPMIDSFEIEGSPNTVGIPLTLRWETTNDVAGNGGQIELSVDGEVFHTAAAGGAGSLDHAFSTAGLQQVTLRAFSPEGEHRVTRTVDIRGVATIARFEVTPDRIDSTVDPLVVNFSWDVQNGRTARIHQVAADGSHVEPPVAVLDGQDGAGNADHDVTPGIHRFVLVADNGAGSKNEATAVAQVDLAEASIAVNKTDVMPDHDTATLSWATKHASEVVITPLVLGDATRPVAREIEAAYVDVALVEGVTEHAASNNDNGYADIAFPEGFAFPFDGQLMTAARVWVDGAISFDFTGTGNGANVPLPAPNGSAEAKRVHLAPFWGNLHLKVDNNHPQGKIVSALSEDEKGPFLAIQWSGAHAWSSLARPSEFNFQTILRPNGTWEYRFGTMTSADSWATGRFATIGYQNLSATFGTTFSSSEPVEGGVAGRSWAFEPATLPASGSMDVALTRGGTFTIWARNDYSAASDSTDEIVFWEKPVIQASAPEAIPAGGEMTITWSATNATAVQIVDSAAPGQPLCEEVASGGTQQTLSGECVVQPAEGLHTYVVRAVGGHQDNVTELVVSTKVNKALGLLAFDANTTLVNPGEAVTLSWATEGAATWALTANGEPVAMPQLESGELVVNPTATTLYVLTIEDVPVGGLPVRTLTESVEVRVRTNSLDVVTTSRTQFAAGTGTQNVTIGWETTNADGVQIGGFVPHEDLTDTPFIDIRSPETAVARTYGNVNEGGYAIEMPADFSFHFDGKRVSHITASTNGWLSFNPITTGWTGTNERLPAATATAGHVHMAPWWDDLDDSHVYFGRGVDAEMGPYVVVQWDAIILNSTVGRLNFQAVLFESGVWDFRTGVMEAQFAARVEGSSITVGFQGLDASWGNTITHNTRLLPAGTTWAWKTIRFTPNQEANGSVNVPVTDTGDIEVCSFDSGYRDCKTVQVVFVQPKDLTITEFNVAPVGPQWIEVRNLSSNTLDLAGFTLKNAAGGAHTFTEQLLLPSGAFAVVAEGEGVSADGIYTGVALSPTDETVSLVLDGKSIDSVKWDSTWNLPVTGSLELDGLHHVRENATGVALASRWCPSTDEMAGGVLGSPGYLGAGCSINEYVVDWVSQRPFIDISATGEDIAKLNSNSGFDTAGEGREIGFPFRFFGTTYDQWYGSSNGLISFNPLPGHYDYDAGQLPRTSGTSQTLVAAFWQNLLDQPGSSVKTALLDRDGQQVRIVQWTGTAISGLNISGKITFQIQLWSGGDIVLGYKDISATPSSLNRFLGSSASIGIQNENRSRALALPYNKPWLVWDGKVIAFEVK